MENRKVAIKKYYTDGSCLSNPGPGGWSSIIVLEDGLSFNSLEGNEQHTTNNRMEIIAVIKTLQYIKTLEDQRNKRHVIHSDSSYVVDGITKGWIDNWMKNGWKTTKGSLVKNDDLWKTIKVELEELSHKGIKIHFVKVKGHDGDIFNEIADDVATSAAQNAKEGIIYENN